MLGLSANNAYSLWKVENERPQSQVLEDGTELLSLPPGMEPRFDEPRIPAWTSSPSACAYKTCLTRAFSGSRIARRVFAGGPLASRRLHPGEAPSTASSPTVRMSGTPSLA